MVKPIVLSAAMAAGSSIGMYSFVLLLMGGGTA